MLIQSIRLSNFGRHENIDFDSSSPVVGLLGPNGVGKSTVLDALELAITGETRDSLDTYVRNGEGNAQVDVSFLKSSKVGRIWRQFGKTSKRKLEWDGRTITSAKEVDATMAEIFGADKKAIANAVFINQGMLERILFSGEADRKSMFIKLVNMAFCSQRARQIDGKVKHLESTIVDLGPMIQAMTTQREAAAAGVSQLRQELEGMKDYSQEIHFCEQFLRDEDLLKRVMATIGQMEHEHQAIQSEIDRLLPILQVKTYEEATTRYAALDEASKMASLTWHHFQTVCAELAHYDRVSGEIQALTDRLNEAMKAIKDANPEGLDLGQIGAKVFEAEVSRDLHVFLNSARPALEKWRAYQKRTEQDIAECPVPSELEPEIKAMQAKRYETHATAVAIENMLVVQERLAGCLEAQPGQEVSKCPDCGLTINVSELGEDKLGMMRQHVVSLGGLVRSLDNKIMLAEKELREYRQFIGERQAGLKNASEEIAKLERQIADSKPQLDEATAARQYDDYTSLKRALPGMQRTVEQEKLSLMAKIKERAGYQLAREHLNAREHYTPLAGVELQKKAEVAFMEGSHYRDPYRSLGQSVSLLEANRKRTQELNEQRTGLERKLEAPMPQDILEIQLELAGNMEATKLALLSRNDVLTLAKGRLAQAQLAYDGINNDYQDLLRRAEGDKAKRILIEDLRVLRELMVDDGLPMAVVRYHFDRLTVLTQESLGVLNANFMVTIDKDQQLGFKFVRLDDKVPYEMPMNKLSGGQRVRLCVAFLMAVQRRLVKEVGLLVLDEPSVHVDPEGVESLAELLRSLQIQLQNTETQVWVSDHNPILENCFGKTLKLT
jgi:exonuclease SbcC